MPHYITLLGGISLTLCLFCLSNGQYSNTFEKPRITSPPSSVGVIAGQQALFMCLVEGNPAPAVSWLVRDSTRLASRFNASKRVPRGAVLRLIKASIADDGAKVTCRAENMMGQEERSASITVYKNKDSAPSGYPRFLNEFSVFVEKKNSNITLECRTEGDPQPTIVWYKDFIPVDLNNPRLQFMQRGSLHIKKTLEEDEGEYVCVASNRHGTRISPIYGLIVRENVEAALHLLKLQSVKRFIPQFISKLGDREVSPGSKVELVCQAKGVPLPIVSWYQGAIKLTSLPSKREGEAVAVLMDVSESVNCTCVATSELGTINDTIRIIVKEVPKPPTHLKIDSIGHNQAKLQWTVSQSREVERYIVYYSPVRNTSARETRVVIARHVPTMNIVLGQMTPFTEYLVSMQAVGPKNALSLHSESIKFTTRELPPSSPPLGISVSAISNQAVSVNWDPPAEPNGKIIAYRVYYTEHHKKALSYWDKFLVRATSFAENREGFREDGSIASKGGHSAMLTHLTFNATYFVCISAVNSAGDGPVSEDYPVIVRAGVLSRPRNFNSHVSSAHEIHLFWSHPDPESTIPIDHYRLSYRALNLNLSIKHQQVMVKRLNNTPTQVTITKLRPNTLYKFELAAVTGAGPGISAFLSAKTKQFVPGAPENVRVKAINSTAIRISWKEPVVKRDEVRHYKLTYYPSDRSGRKLSINQRPHERTVPVNSIDNDNVFRQVVGQLKADTYYQFTIYSLSTVGRGDLARAIPIKTRSKPPSAPRKLTLRLACQSIRKCVNTSWLAPLKPGSSVVGYRVRFRIVSPEGLTDGETERNVTTTFLTTDPSEHMFGVTYQFRVAAKNSIDIGEESVQEITMPESAPSDSPTHFSMEDGGPTAITLRWGPPPPAYRNGQITLYQVRYYIINEEDTTDTNLNVTHGTSVTLRNLRQYSNYAFQVRAWTRKGPGPLSNRLLLKTQRNTPPPPNGIRAVRISTMQLKITWNKPSFRITGFVVYYSTKDLPQDKAVWQRKPADMKTSIVLNNLASNLAYAVRVASVDTNGQEGPWSEPVVEQLLNRPNAIPVSVAALRCTAQSASHLTVRWTPPRLENGLFQYRINYTGKQTYVDASGRKRLDQLPEEEKIQHFEAGIYDVEYRLIKLRPNTEYTINVEPVYRSLVNVMPTAVNTVCQTGISKPAFVAPPTILHIDRQAGLITLKLSRVTQRNGPVHRYYLLVTPAQFATSNRQTRIGRSTAADTAPKTPDQLSLPLLVRNVDTSSDRAAYLAATFASKKLFPPSSSSRDKKSWNFVLGKGDTYSPADSGGQGINKVLVKGADYRAALRACVEMSQSSRLCTTSAWSDHLNTNRPLNLPTNTNPGPRSSLLSIAIITVIAGLALIAVLCIGTGCLLRRKRSKPSLSTRHLHSNNHPLTGTLNGDPLSKQPLMPPLPPPAYTAPTATGLQDPVEMCRINCQSPGMVSHPPVPISRLQDHVDDLKANEGQLFATEYESIDPGQQFTWQHSNLEVNKPKNRYANVIAYDHSRVVLQPLDAMQGSDYVNANYMDGYRKQNAYIATQGPLPETTGDFWRMIWEQRCATVVMMTRLEERSRVKCDQYWPSRGTANYGLMTLTHLDTIELAYYVIRTFALQRAGSSEKREVRQFQFTAWPDHGVPQHPTPLLIFLRRVRASNPPDAGPLVVHCSAGVGRTGAFIVIDAMLERIKHEKTVDVYGHVTCLRAQRNYMVQTEDQYIFIHSALLEAVANGNTEVPARNLLAHVQKLNQRDSNVTMGAQAAVGTGLDHEFYKLTLVKPDPRMFESANQSVNQRKNRLVNILPPEQTRVLLRPIRGVEGSDYINASHIDGYRCRGDYIAAQGPLPDTIEDFWRLLWEQNSTIVVMLTKLREMGREKCHQYWPSERSARYQYFVVDPMAEYNMPNFILREFKVTDARDGQSRTIRQFQFTEWPEQGVPPSGEAFIDFIGQVHKTKEQFGQDGPITVHCSAGAGRTGVFLTLSIVLERMRYEGVVDMFQTVKMLRSQRPSMVQSEDQYQFCYSSALEYLSSFDHYAS